MFPPAMLFALATGNKIGLAAMGGTFILFALVSAMVVPRLSPNFPGRGLRWYLVLCFAFFCAMIAAILVLAKEKKGAEAAGEAPAAASAAPAAKGDAAAGKTIFGAQGCAACHTFKPAGSTGTVGPDLDKLPESAAAAKMPLDAFIKQSIVDPNAYIAPGYAKGVMPPNFGTTLSAKQVDDLVAFLAQGK
jgi:mono/diheme cytochrome c family protein